MYTRKIPDSDSRLRGFIALSLDTVIVQLQLISRPITSYKEVDRYVCVRVHRSGLHGQSNLWRSRIVSPDGISLSMRIAVLGTEN